MKKSYVDIWIRWLPLAILLFSSFYLIIVFYLSWQIDFRQAYVRGVSEWTNQFPVSIFWLHINREGFLTENLQWLFLWLTFFIGIICYSRLHKTYQINLKYGVLLFTIGVFLMILEDMFNIRHILANKIIAINTEGHALSIEVSNSIIRTLVEVSFYSIIGAIMLLAFIKLFFLSRLSTKTKYYLFSGYGFYAIASIASATRHIGDWYVVTGKYILDKLLVNNVAAYNPDSIMFSIHPLSYYFMDHLVEESFELMGSTLLLGAIIYILITVIDGPS
ncbi:hypothetical protein [Natronogracilivirga saccharolytica]|uniref:Uncharacterized protein n=1 Tax=Natronogracilivirga saccharolytica TaxID=2812953 RepID=A0A8J7UUU6_9BACT|nr:hypothetical protein [Natronogracilivirga saccharolytica]MBP3191897.1 hypothetical protein [Natronogracilivirga saccharolytica]